MLARIKNTLFSVMLLSCMIIGVRFYLELDARNSADPFVPETGQVSTASETLPQFTLNDIYGEPHSIDEWSGQSLLINFWATWCAPCRREIPLLQSLHTEQSSTGIQVIGIAIDRQPDVAAFIGEYGVSYPSLVGQEDAMAVSDLFGLEGLGLPFSVLSASDSNILTVHIGEINAEQLAELVGISKAYAAGTLPLADARGQLAKL
jgi:thiol-disulfide isomerase/thioredoxin